MKNQRTPLIIFFTLILFSCLHLPKDIEPKPELYPSDVVELWMEVYGTELTKAAELTTENLRKGRLKEIWAKNSEWSLKKIDFRHLGGFIHDETIEGDKATVLVESQIYIVAGKTKQKEVYHLKKVDGKWLIDGIEIKDEWIENPRN